LPASFYSIASRDKQQRGSRSLSLLAAAAAAAAVVAAAAALISQLNSASIFYAS
jgi:hypothetical protein